MKSVKLHGTDLHTSKLIFGTSHLFRAGLRNTRLRLLQEAVGAGFTHFDTAPLYEHGIAEEDIGILKKLNSHITITTKVGIYPPGGATTSPWRVLGKKIVSKLNVNLMAPEIDFDLLRAQRSLEGSLSRLKRDHVDLFLVHEPNFSDLCIEEWFEWLEALKSEGKIREFGISGKLENVLQVIGAGTPSTPVIQLQDSLDADDETKKILIHPQITYGYFSEAIKLNPKIKYFDVLKSALQVNKQGYIIISSNNFNHVRDLGKFMDKE